MLRLRQYRFTRRSWLGAVCCTCALLFFAGAARAFVEDPRELFRTGAGVGGENDQFGNFVAASGDLLVGSTPDAGSGRGKAYVFRAQRGRWVFQSALTSPLPPPDLDQGNSYDGFGRVVAIDAGRILLGGRGLFVFTPAGPQWTSVSVGDPHHWWEDARLVGDRIVAFGARPDTFVIELCLFARSGVEWALQSCLPLFPDSSLGYGGTALAFDGTYVVIGTRPTGVRRTAIYRIEAGGFVSDALIERPAKVVFPGSFVGNAEHWLALDGGVLALGTDSGVDLLHRDGSGWVADVPSMAQLGNGSTIFKTTLDLRDGLLLAQYQVAAPTEPPTPGATYRRASIRGDGTRRALALGPGFPGTDDSGGAVVCLDGTRCVIGLPRQVQGRNEDQGAVLEVDLVAGADRLDAGSSAAPGYTGKWFGQQVSVGGDRLLVGADFGSSQGFERRAGVWLPLGEIDPVSGHPQQGVERHGVMGADGEALIALAGLQPEHDGGYQGELKVYGASPDGWVLRQSIPAPATVVHHLFGGAIATSGSTLALGTPTNGSQPYDGAVYLFERDASGWALSQRIDPLPRPAIRYAFGRVVALAQDRLAIQACCEFVDVYRRGAQGWELEASLGGPGYYGIGDALALGDGLLAVGTYGNDGVHLSVWERNGSDWQPFELQLPPGVPLQSGMPALAFDGDTLLASISRFDDGEFAGRTGVASYRRNEFGEWALEDVLPGPSSKFNGGASLAMDHDRLVLGTPGAELGDTAQVGRLTTYTREDEAQALPASTSGIWYDPARSGEGFLLEILPDGAALVVWFTFPDAGSAAAQAWILGQGHTDGNRVVFDDAIAPYGPKFGAAYDVAALRFASWGRMEFVFGGCGSGTMSFRTRDGARDGTRELVQISALAGLPCSGQGAPSAQQFDGTWYDPARTGEGILLQFPTPDRAIATWFTYDDQGRQSWVIGDGQRVGDTVTFGSVVRPVGTHFGADFDPSAVTRTPWGTFTLHLVDCTHVTLDYASLDPLFGTGTRSLARLTQPAGTQCQ